MKQNKKINLTKGMFKSFRAKDYIIMILEFVFSAYLFFISETVGNLTISISIMSMSFILLIIFIENYKYPSKVLLMDIPKNEEYNINDVKDMLKRTWFPLTFIVVVFILLIFISPLLSLITIIFQGS